MAIDTAVCQVVSHKRHATDTIVMCRWSSDVYKQIGGTEYTGVDDSRLFVWPGKGLFAITGRKAEVLPGTSPSCSRFNWVMYLAQVRLSHVAVPPLLNPHHTLQRCSSAWCGAVHRRSCQHQHQRQCRRTAALRCIAPHRAERYAVCFVIGQPKDYAIDSCAGVSRNKCR